MLQSVNLSSSGRYRCEVSGEAPSFNTVDGYGDMVVVGKQALADSFLWQNIMREIYLSVESSEIEKCSIRLWYSNGINIPDTEWFLIIFHAFTQRKIKRLEGEISFPRQ